jgi:aspartyl-tRNA(Asn)/glutamyl-tRNA(Gln) amidotransferase subunit C
MAIDLKEIEHIATLAMLELSNEEKGNLSQQLTSIIDWVGKLSELDTTNVSPPVTVMQSAPLLRKDEPVKFNETDIILSNVPTREYDFVKVKKVINND